MGRTLISAPTGSGKTTLLVTSHLPRPASSLAVAPAPPRGRVRSLILAATHAGWKGSLPESVYKGRLVAVLREASLAASKFTEVGTGTVQRGSLGAAMRGVGVDNGGLRSGWLPAHGSGHRGPRHTRPAPEHSCPDPSGLG